MSDHLASTPTGLRTITLRTDPVQILWLGFASLVIGLLIVCAPEGYRNARDLTDLSQADAASMRTSLNRLHLTAGMLAILQMVINTVGMLVNFAVSWLLIRSAKRTWFTVYVGLVFVALAGATYPPAINEILPGMPVWQNIARAITIFAISGFFTLPFIFPNGRFVPRWMAVFAVYGLAGVCTLAYLPEGNLDYPIWVWMDRIFLIAFVLALFTSVIYRYRRVSTPEQQEQTRWVVFGLLIGLPGFFLGDLMMRNIGPGLAGIICLFGFLIVMPIAFAAPTVTIGIAILQHGLFDIDVILSRTLVWLTMTLAVIASYIGIVTGIGSLLDARGNILLSLIATGLVAVGFQPAYLRIQRLIRRWIYGDRDDPYAVLRRLGHRIEAAIGNDELLPAIVRTTTEALRLPYAALFLNRPDGLVLAASSGVPTVATLSFPLTYGGEHVGTLAVGERAQGDTFSRSDRALLEDLARQVGVAARTVNLTADLQRSREQIVIAREEERRRLRRDLHDGLGSQLAALLIQTGGIRTLISGDPDAAGVELSRLRDELKTAVGEIRRLVLGLRPPSLDELGLVGALQERLHRLDLGGIDADSRNLRIAFSAADVLPALTAAAEVALYRIVEEAVTNVVKHSGATQAAVVLSSVPQSISVEISDNGIGIVPGEHQGVGLTSMRERAAELGGSVVVTAGPGGTGTRVTATLPAQIGPGL